PAEAGFVVLADFNRTYAVTLMVWPMLCPVPLTDGLADALVLSLSLLVLLCSAWR
ncbi:hypothetical protein HX890_25965, partial [Pseudomonas gingeri]|nr:hypothetical protein [Pseudomonas gingeri]